MRGVLERLAEYGYGTVQPVTTANETLVFALPREIRKVPNESLKTRCRIPSYRPSAGSGAGRVRASGYGVRCAARRAARARGLVAGRDRLEPR